MISAWFETHKYYPDSARQRGEEGSVGLSFRVDRFGRVLNYTLLTSTGYADLDAGIDQMMRGAQLPPFPAGMTAPEIEVSVKIRFSLAR
jgi:periplasmic protein TonB